MDFQQAYKEYRPLIYSIAYRMLGSHAEAEDLVQDVFADYSRVDAGEIRSVKAYLTRMATNRCLNEAQSARKRREVYVGNWLPEPDVSFAGSDPAEQYARREDVSYALLVMLERLSPVERAVFILRESLDYEYGEIAECLQKTEANCRKIFSRAKEKLQLEREALPSNERRAEPLISAFIEAARSGSLEELTRLLTEDALLVSDGGGKVRAAIFPIVGRERVLAFLQGVIPKGFLGDERRLASVNGQLGIVTYEAGRVRSVVSFQMDEAKERLERIYVQLNPEKLGHVKPFA